MTAFERCRSVLSQDVARHLGLALTHHGSRARAICPFHADQNPSLVFYPDGRYFCFGCQAHGDAVDFYAAYMNVSRREAATALASSAPAVAQTFPVPVSRVASNAASILMNRVDDWYRRECDAAIECIFESRRLIELEHEARRIILADGLEYDPPPCFFQAVARESAATQRLDALALLDAYGKLKLMVEEGKYEQAKGV